MHLPMEICNPETGEQIVFDEDASSDERLVWDECRPAHSEPSPVHYHPTTEESFLVREGPLVVQIDGIDNRLTDGEEITIPPETPHVSYTEEDAARFRRAVSPPEKWRELLTERFAFAHVVGERSGVGGLLQAALWLRAYPDVLVLERPPRPVQDVLFPILALIAQATGRTTHHPYPRDSSDRMETSK